MASRIVSSYDQHVSQHGNDSETHRVSRYVASAAPNCLGSYLRLFAKRGIMSAKLRTEITAYQMCILDDSFVEGPHASIGRAARAAPKGTNAWWSATLRLAQTCRMREAMDSQPGRFAWYFARWKMLAQKEPGQYDRGRPAKKKTPDFCNFVYRSGFCSTQDWSALGLKAFRPQENRADRHADRSQVAALQRDYVRCVFRPGCIFSLVNRAARNTQTLTTDNQDSDVMATASHMYFQVVDTGLVRKKHVDSEALAAWRRMSCPAKVQYMRMWHGGRSAEDCATVYQDEWPEPVDIMMLAA